MFEQTRHKKGRRAKSRNGFYILICGGFESKLLSKDKLAAIRDLLRSSNSEWTTDAIAVQFKNGKKNKAAIFENLKRLEWFGIVNSRNDGTIKHWQHLECDRVGGKTATFTFTNRETLQAMNYRNLITIESGKRSGKPCIRGMRITVYDVLSYLASGMTYQEVLEDFPYLTLEDIFACLSYAADREQQTLLVQA